jgi:protein phosphatase
MTGHQQVPSRFGRRRKFKNPYVIDVYVPSVVVLIGPSGSGKSTFAQREFGEHEVVSSDRCRAMIADSEADQSVTPAAFELLRFISRKRLAAGRLVVIDATNIHAHARWRNLELAQQAGVPAIAIVFDVSAEYCLANNGRRARRVVPVQVVTQQRRELIQAISAIEHEGFTAVHRLDESSIERITVLRSSESRARGDGPHDLHQD